MDNQKRTLLAIALSMAVLFVWFGLLFPPKTATRQHADGGVSDGGASSAATSPPAPRATAAVDGGTVAAAPASPVARPPERTHRIRTEKMEVVLSSWGGTLRSAKLFGEKMRRKVEEKEDQVDLVRIREGGELPLTIGVSGLGATEGAEYEMEPGERGATFSWSGPGARVVKTYVLRPETYTLDLKVEVTNTAAEARAAALSLSYPAWVNPASEEEGGFMQPQGNLTFAIARAAGKTQRHRHAKDKARMEVAGPVAFTGVDERYFLAAIVPRDPAGVGVELLASATGDFAAVLQANLGTLEAGATASRVFSVFLGPKDIDVLNAAAAARPAFPAADGLAVELGQSVDFGLWAVICRLLLAVMRFFQRFVVNWGIAIVLLTVLVKIILLPLTYKQMVAMEGMRKLQPQMEEIRKKHAQDKEKMNLEMMKLYREHNVNPLSGCLPLLLQMPVWWALYQTLLSSFELYRSKFIWISDLAGHDPVYVLPLAMGVTMFITQKMQPVQGDPTQAKILLYFMPVFFTFIMLKLPAGLTLYIFTNNLLSIAQQWYLRRRFGTPTKPSAAPDRAAARGK